MMWLKLILILVGVVQLSWASGGGGSAPPSLYTCIDWECEEWISQGRTMLRYSGKTEKHLSFGKNQQILIVSKPVSKDGPDWVGKIGTKVGLVPRDMVREEKVNKNPTKFKLDLAEVLEIVGLSAAEEGGQEPQVGQEVKEEIVTPKEEEMAKKEEEVPKHKEVDTGEYEVDEDDQEEEEESNEVGVEIDDVDDVPVTTESPLHEVPEVAPIPVPPPVDENEVTSSVNVELAQKSEPELESGSSKSDALESSVVPSPVPEETLAPPPVEVNTTPIADIPDFQDIPQVSTSSGEGVSLEGSGSLPPQQEEETLEEGSLDPIQFFSSSAAQSEEVPPLVNLQPSTDTVLQGGASSTILDDYYLSESPKTAEVPQISQDLSVEDQVTPRIPETILRDTMTSLVGGPNVTGSEQVIPVVSTTEEAIEATKVQEGIDMLVNSTPKEEETGFRQEAIVEETTREPQQEKRELTPELLEEKVAPEKVAEVQPDEVDKKEEEIEEDVEVTTPIPAEDLPQENSFAEDFNLVGGQLDDKVDKPEDKVEQEATPDKMPQEEAVVEEVPSVPEATEPPTQEDDEELKESLMDTFAAVGEHLKNEEIDIDKQQQSLENDKVKEIDKEQAVEEQEDKNRLEEIVTEVQGETESVKMSYSESVTFSVDNPQNVKGDADKQEDKVVVPVEKPVEEIPIEVPEETATVKAPEPEPEVAEASTAELPGQPGTGSQQDAGENHTTEAEVAQDLLEPAEAPEKEPLFEVIPSQPEEETVPEIIEDIPSSTELPPPEKAQQLEPEGQASVTPESQQIQPEPPSEPPITELPPQNPPEQFITESPPAPTEEAPPPSTQSPPEEEEVPPEPVPEPDTHSHGHHHHHHRHAHPSTTWNASDTSTSSILLVIKHLSSTLLSFLPEALQDTILDVDSALVFTGIIALTLVSICVPYFLIEGFMAIRPLKKKVTDLNKSLWTLTAAYETQSEEYEIYKQKAISHDAYLKRAEQSENHVAVLKELELKHREQIQKLKGQLKLHAKEAMDIRALIERSLRDKKEVEEEMRGYKEAADKAVEQLGRVREELAGFQKATKSTSLQLQSKVRNEEMLEKKIEMLEETQKGLRGQLEVEGDKRRRLGQEVGKLRHEAKEKEQELAEIKGICGGYEKTVEGLNEEIMKLESELESVREALGEDSPLLEVAEVQAKAEFNEREARSLRTRLEGMCRDNEVLRERLKEMEGRLEGIREEKEGVDTRLKVLEEYFKEREEELMKQIEKLEERESVRDKGKEELIEMLEERGRREQELEGMVEGLKEEFEEMKGRHREEIRGLEAKEHENWLSLCQAERKQQDARKEAEMLRQKLTKLVKERREQEEDEMDGGGDGLEGIGMLIPHELVPPPIMGDLEDLEDGDEEILNGHLGHHGHGHPASYFGLGDFVPPPPLEDEDEQEVGVEGRRRPPPLGGTRFSSNSPSFSLSDEEEDEVLARDNNNLRRRRDEECTDGSSGSGSASPAIRGGGWMHVPGSGGLRGGGEGGAFNNNRLPQGDNPSGGNSGGGGGRANLSPNQTGVNL